MLYQRWSQIAKDHWRERALRDAATGQQWTFGELFQLGEGFDCGSGRVVYPQKHSVEFILMILGAWRSGQVVCPLEKEQTQAIQAVTGSPFADPWIHLKTTSATTGQSQKVAFTAPQLLADADNIVATMGLRPDWPNIGVISLAHSYGFSNLVLPLLLHGVPLILVPSPLPEVLRQACAQEQELTLAAVPALWRAWHDVGIIPPNLRKAISAGAPLSIALERDVFEQTGLKIHNFYGSTECGGIAYDATEQPRINDAFVGTPLQNVDVCIGENGCLEVRSQAVGETYWPTPGSKLGSGRFQTEDMAEIHSGAIHLLGRIGDLINVAGRKIAPKSI